MESFTFDVSENLNKLCQKHKNECWRFNTLLSKQIWNTSDREELLDKIAQLYTDENLTVSIVQHFTGIILDIIERCKLLLNSHIDHILFCIAGSKTIEILPHLAGYFIDYVTSKDAFFNIKEAKSMDEPIPKKAKQSKRIPSKSQIAEAVYIYLKHGCGELRKLWDWSELIEWLSSDSKTRWYTCECISMLLSLSPNQMRAFKQQYLSKEEILELSLQLDRTTTKAINDAMHLTHPTAKGPQTSSLTHTLHEIVDTDFSDTVISVCGVLLSKQTSTCSSSTNFSETIVMVPSTQRNLKSLAIAVSSASYVLLEGPVGCGKTALVELLAEKTGRTKPPAFMKIQLGDQTDSKALLGTYRCTDVPGEFVWQAGSLTRAVTEGNWVLLEDLDYAPMDVISILVPLLESKTLSLPGHGDTITAHPEFRLFATQRWLSSGCGWYKQHGSGASILDKLWTKITLEPLSRTEIKQVVDRLHPALTSVVDRLVDIYFLLSAGRHELAADDQHDADEENTDVGKFLSNHGRLVSTRDLIKWIGRISSDFDVTQSSAGNMVFQEALDCFCSCLSNPEKRLPLAEAIASKLNITKAKAEFYVNKYKPNIEIRPSALTVGRVTLPRKIAEFAHMSRRDEANFAFTRQSVTMLERVACCIARNEPVLLVGETGVGKTSSVQYLAGQLGQNLNVINMNQQSDSTDLLGGFKPVEIRTLVAPFREDFELLFCKSFSRKQNGKFLAHIQECFNKRKWSDLFTLMEHTQKAAIKRYTNDAEKLEKWQKIGRRLRALKTQVKQVENSLAFAFIEGSLVKAVKSGDWVLLDEINLASAETLECLSGLLESSGGSIVLMERGDTEPIVRHPNFRLFACMNPATDVGKKDLPPGVRNRFTELYVDELDDVQDLKILVAEYLKGLALSAKQIDGIVRFYITIKKEAVNNLSDGTGHRPHISLRTFCRALSQAAGNKCGNVLRSLYEGFCLSFLTQLDRTSHPVVIRLIIQHVLGGKQAKAALAKPLPQPIRGEHQQFEGYWLEVGNVAPCVPDGYVLTPSVRENLKDLVRVVSVGRYPVLIQGETSVGKTSLVNWLASSSGNKCVRINNHEHTDLQEYVGCYAADESGKLVFKEGVLVEAMRKGHWIILDELNLAPTDVLEALNRLLDDNRELFIPETQETVKAHPQFMLFATQNPPGQYGGRKVLSRAFRNRFVELHFDEIPPEELQTILHQRCCLPFSYCKKLVAILLELQTLRRGSSVFMGKQGFITLRDLFRWAERYHQASYETNEKFFDWDQQLADNGYMLLAGRVRKPEECVVIQKVLEKHLKRKVGPQTLFSTSDKTSPTAIPILREITQAAPSGDFGHVVWTESMRRMAVLVGQALKFSEPLLLVGETGCGKTTICQIFASLKGKNLYTINCHLHTESADFLGGLRPVRHRDETDKKSGKLFEWVDGPLVRAMKEGAILLIDEISLADDSVLERLNSVLEPERTLLLAEKGGDTNNEVEIIKAHEDFRVVATMNPGGDFGKKELSPALRNRFTEIWCPQSMGRSDLISIIEHNIRPGIHLCNQEDGTSGFGNAIMDFVEWFSNNEIGKRVTVSIRDLLSWVHFINRLARGLDQAPAPGRLEPALAYVHGACMVFLDALGTGTTSLSDASALSMRTLCLNFLQKQFSQCHDQPLSLSDLGIMAGPNMAEEQVVFTEDSFGVKPFFIPRGPLSRTAAGACAETYALTAPTTCVNAQRVMRGLQLARPVLLEGSPGVGKTSLVAALARAAGHTLVRINLSEQTDVSDLFGADLPVEGGEGGQFAWRDGPLLQALKHGHWVVLDELNLASQSVLEGLNAVLDHRGAVYVPELGATFAVQRGKTRLFACQNPLNQGGGRKGLPKSFLNRFTQVYVESLTKDDLLFISSTMYPQIPQDTLVQMIQFNSEVVEQIESCSWGQRGSPWEFNLRDVFRWCDLMVANQAPGHYDPAQWLYLVYVDRMRTAADKQRMIQLFHNKNVYLPSGHLHVTHGAVQLGHSLLERADRGYTAAADRSLTILHHSLAPLESVMKCVEMNWMTILVGSSGSGKTCVVELLALLAGRPLDVLPMNSAIDTTELLGGFEQADLKRHVEELGTGVWTVVQRTVTRLLLTARPPTDRVQQLVSAWHAAVTAGTGMGADGAAKSRQDEVKDVLVKLNAFQEVVTLLQAWNTESEDVASVASRLQKLLTTCETWSNQAGQFEWIDSILVKALVQGHWLLIDNVNFCSASVLDRLNALLEPNGELSINERGVIDGTIPTIRPHPNFRLFLAMDPQHGEISRAMRNRGVEIYIMAQAEGVPYSDHDLVQMIRGAGVPGAALCAALLRLYRAMSAPATRPVVELLKLALLTARHLHRGADVRTAALTGALEVFVRGELNSTRRKECQEIIGEHLRDLDLLGVEQHDGAGSALVAPAVWPLSAPGAAEWASTALTIAALQHNTAYFSHVVDVLAIRLVPKSSIPLSVSELCGVIRPYAQERLQDYLAVLPALVTMALESGSTCDWHLQKAWLLKMISDRLGPDVATLQHETLTEELKVVKALPKIIDKQFETVFQHQLMAEVPELLKLLCKSEKEHQLLIEQSFDLRWNPDLIYRLHMSRLREAEFTQQGTLHQLACIANQLYIVQHLQGLSVLHEAASSGYERRKKHKQRDATAAAFSPLQLSRAVNEGLLQKAPLPLAEHLYPFVQLLHAELTALFSTYQEISDNQLARCVQSVAWFDRFVDVCCQVLPPTDDILPELSLHWNWLYSHMVEPLFEKYKVSSGLHAVLSLLHERLGVDNVSARLYLAVWRRLGHPAPYSSEETAGAELHLTRLLALMDVSRSEHGHDQKLPAKLAVLLDKGEEIRLAALKMMCDLATLPSEDVQSATQDGLNLLESLIQQYRLSPDPEQQALDVTTSVEVTKVVTWPLFDWLSICTHYHLLSEVLAGTSMNDDHLKYFVDFNIANVHNSARPMALWCRVIETKNLEEIDNELYQNMLFNYFDSLWNGFVTRNVDYWLHWQKQTAEDFIETGDKKVACIQGPACTQTAMLSYCLSHLLTSAKSQELVTSQIVLGAAEQKMAQLEALTHVMWKQSGTSGAQTDNHTNLLISAFKKLFGSLSSLLPDDQQLAFQQLLQTLSKDDISLFMQLKQCVQSINLAPLLESADKVIEGVIEATIEYLSTISLEEDNDSNWGERVNVSLGTCWGMLGLLQSHLLAPQGPVDPAYKLMIKLGYLKNELTSIDKEIEARNQQSLLSRGKELDLENLDTLHPKLKCMVLRKQEVEKLIQDYSKQKAFRPSPSPFQYLLQEVKQYQQTHGHPTRITKFIKKCTSNSSDTSNLLNEISSWQTVTRQIVNSMMEKYPHYKDVLVPFVCGISQVQYGLSILSAAVNKRAVLSGILPTCNNLHPEDVLSILAQFPLISPNTTSVLSAAEKLVEENTIAAVNGYMTADGDREQPVSMAQSVSRLLKAALYLTQNHIVTAGHFSTDAQRLLHHLMTQFVDYWQKQEMERKQKAEEQEALYKYKTQTHGEDLTEEQREELEIGQYFPSFEQDFQDITVGFTLADKPKSKVPDLETRMKKFKEDLKMQVSQEEMFTLCQIHHQLMVQFTSTSWFEPAEMQQKSVDWIKPFMECYEVATSITKGFSAGIDVKMDKHLLPGHLLACSVLQNTMNDKLKSYLEESSKPYDFYYDPNVGEVVKCRALLERFIARLEELLAEWPDHPTLRQLVLVARRIQEFSVSAPLMKYVTGIEVLLQKAQEWESTAARHVSLQQQLGELSEQLVAWRQFELRCWNSCLSTAAYKMRARAGAKWWGHVHQLVQGYLQEPVREEEMEEECTSPDADLGGAERMSAGELVRALQQFMETCGAGEFQTRLGLLLAFHCHVTQLPAGGDRQEELANLLWNIYKHYQQFEKAVTFYIEQKKSPIEKELKAFVKIARWNDINFYALKQAVDKTHRTLRKHIKQFEEVLNHPVRPLLTDSAPEWANQAEQKQHQWSEFMITQFILQEKVPAIELEDVEGLFSKLPAYLRKMEKHSSNILLSLPYNVLAKSLDEFTGEMIETIHSLQSLDVSQIKDKGKQKSEAKHIHLRKRKSLADLFKLLQKLGLSYRKGLMSHNVVDTLSIMLVPALDVSVAIKPQNDDFHSADSTVTAAWTDCDKYYRRCVSRFALLQSALITPSKELGPPILDRCKGFAAHLQALVHEQWSSLAQLTQHIATLKKQVKILQTVIDDGFVIDQSQARDWVLRLRDLHTSATELVEQVCVLVGCCPSAPASAPVSPRPAAVTAPMSSVTAQDQQWSELQATIMECKSILSEAQKNILAFDLDTLYGMKDVQAMQKVNTSLQSLLTPLGKIKDGFTIPTSSEFSCLVDSVQYICQEIDKANLAFVNWESDINKPLESINSDVELELICKETLLGVQDLVKFCKNRSAKDENKEKCEFDELEEGHITELMHQNILNEIKDMRIEKVVTHMQVFLSCVCRGILPSAPSRLRLCCHLMRRYTLLGSAYLAHLVTSHRTAAKLQSVMLAVFAELAQKGFCLPAEYSDEAAGDGATQFEDIEGGGLGEGEGAKDVSDQIESEDQLDEARKADEEKENDKGDQPDIKSEDNAIEMSEDFDGKMQELEDQEGDENEDEEKTDENELDKQMGDLGDDNADKLDEQVWGDDEEESKEESEDKKEETGPGAGEQTETELVAKDENTDDGTKPDDNKDKEKGKDDPPEEERKPNDLEEMDEREYDENEVDPHHGADKKEEEPPALDLPDDLNLDQAQEDEDEETGEGKQDENPHDIDQLADDLKDVEESNENDEADAESGQEEEGGVDEANEDTKEDLPEDNARDEESPKDDEKQDESKPDDPMEVEDEGLQPDQNERGLNPENEGDDKEEQQQQDNQAAEDVAQADQSGKTEHETTDVQQVEQAKDAASGQTDSEKEQQGVGVSESQQQEGHEGEESRTVTAASERQQRRSQAQRRPGQSKEERTVGSVDEKIKKNLNTVDSSLDQNDDDFDKNNEADLYEHIKDSKTQHSAQTLDAATEAQEQAVVGDQEEEEAEAGEEDVRMEEERDSTVDEHKDIKKLSAKDQKKDKDQAGDDDQAMDVDAPETESQKMETPGAAVTTDTVARGAESSIHTAVEHLTMQTRELDLDKLRESLEADIREWGTQQTDITPDQVHAAQEAWQKYEAVTGTLAQELCEQLRLVLEPSQATKLKGDYRTGKRLNMRKVIPYIASQFRKDKIWLRRTKPSKRNYQIMLAIDDSSSMADNHSRQLAFESLAVVANALTLLEAGQISICSFGETVQMLHSFNEQFSSQSGANILQRFTFAQNKTKIAQMVRHMTGAFTAARSFQQGAVNNVETAQLLLIVSDGRGIFLEGMDVVKSAVKEAREANIFIAFVIIDNPENKDSILDIRVPVFKSGGLLPEIKSYMDSFPFPFYLILKDINSLPTILSDALRQWFELVTASDL